MILGVFINGFKSYSQTAYIHLCNDDNYKFTTIVGKNGTGKSAILESINFYFKQGPWNANKQSKNKEDMFISPVFLIEKESLKKWLSESIDFRDKKDELAKNFEWISNYLWEEADDSFKGATRRQYIKEFFSHLDTIKSKYSESHFLLVAGRNIDNKSISKPFSNIKKVLENKFLDQLNNVISMYYNYIYIPVEQQAQSTLKIENIQMQKIMNQNVLLKIESLLKEKLNVDGKNQSLIDHINNQLAVFVEDINSVIKELEPNYEFKSAKNKRQNLTASDIVDNILKGYFSKRPLKSSSKEINELSSGEQRRAMIDIVYIFLKNRGKEEEANGRNVILAIDEPEVSQDINNCFEQFERLEKLSNYYGNQVLVTTHWYGILPVIEQGTLLHLSETKEADYKNKFSIFDFYNYLDRQAYFPDEIKLKSIYDLAISLSIYIRKKTSKHLILCEGGTDKRYLETLIDTSKVRVLPVGGIDNVKNLFNLLVMPLSIDKKLDSQKRVLCLTDTDPNIQNNSNFGSDPSGKIQIKRLQINVKENSVDLVSLDNFNPNLAYRVTRIEDVIDPKIYIKVIQTLFSETKDEFNENSKKIQFNLYEFNENSVFSNLNGDTDFLFCKTPEASRNKQDLISFIESNKAVLSFEYVKEFERIYSSNENVCIPPVFNSIENFFKETILKSIIFKKNKIILK